MNRDKNVYTTLFEDRLNGEINQHLMKDQKFKSADNYTQLKVNQLIETGLTKKQKKKIDKITCAYNISSVEFARIAYYQGIKDGFRLFQELIDKPEN